MWKTFSSSSFSTQRQTFPQHFPQPLWKTILLATTFKSVFHISTGCVDRRRRVLYTTVGTGIRTVRMYLVGTGTYFSFSFSSFATDRELSAFPAGERAGVGGGTCAGSPADLECADIADGEAAVAKRDATASSTRPCRGSGGELGDGRTRAGRGSGGGRIGVGSGPVA